MHNLALLTFAFAGVVSIGVNAEEAQPPGVIETWTCSYNPGKDIDDVLAARDYYVKQAARSRPLLAHNGGSSTKPRTSAMAAASSIVADTGAIAAAAGRPLSFDYATRRLAKKSQHEALGNTNRFI